MNPESVFLKKLEEFLSLHTCLSGPVKKKLCRFFWIRLNYKFLCSLTVPKFNFFRKRTQEHCTKNLYVFIRKLIFSIKTVWKFFQWSFLHLELTCFLKEKNSVFQHFLSSEKGIAFSIIGKIKSNVTISHVQKNLSSRICKQNWEVFLFSSFAQSTTILDFFQERKLIN